MPMVVGHWLPHRRRSGRVRPRAYADQGLNRIPDAVSDEQALFVGDVLATGFWAARISEITEKDTVLIIGAALPESAPCFA